MPTATTARPYAARYASQVRGAVALAAGIADRFGFTREQIEKAGQLLADGGVLPTQQRGGVFRTVSADGERRYFTSEDICTCMRGQHGRPCYHRAAVIILTAVAENEGL